ncbi:hypothetical protein BJ138DRAFT_1107634 [Hygrophoropsis aurantiaca]|uniref:Uncharacterized protein n=1 Tax=Hygrophoropsis aurantiaca TaxID=72124 RepID=A0ACB7ZRV2_9AGAM|nr:hypothetical protein BJ138DRAFT_1107634 [Hygrophoropsis aurantiaca]
MANAFNINIGATATYNPFRAYFVGTNGHIYQIVADTGSAISVVDINVSLPLLADLSNTRSYSPIAAAIAWRSTGTDYIRVYYIDPNNNLTELIYSDTGPTLGWSIGARGGEIGTAAPDSRLLYATVAWSASTTAEIRVRFQSSSTSGQNMTEARYTNGWSFAEL